MSEGRLLARIEHRIQALMDTHPISATHGHPLVTAQPWGTMMVAALGGTLVPGLLERSIRWGASLQDQKGGFGNDPSLDPTPWVALSFAVARRFGLDREVARVVDDVVTRSLTHVHESMKSYSIMELLATMAFCAEAGDPRGVERSARHLERKWSALPQVVPHFYHAAWLLGIAAARAHLPEWLMERYGALLYGIGLLQTVQGQIVPFPWWDRPFVAGALRWALFHAPSLGLEEAVSTEYARMLSLPDEPFAAAVAALYTSPPPGGGEGDMEPLDTEDASGRLGIHALSAGRYTAVVIPCTDAFFVLDADRNVLKESWGVTLRDTDGRIMASIPVEPQVIDVGQDTVSYTVRLTARGWSAPMPVRRLLGHGRKLVAALPLGEEGLGLVSAVVRRLSPVPSHTRRIRVTPEGVGCVDTIEIPASMEVTEGVLGAVPSSWDQRFWATGDGAVGMRPLGEADVAILNERGTFEVRTIVS